MVDRRPCHYESQSHRSAAPLPARTRAGQPRAGAVRRLTNRREVTMIAESPLNLSSEEREYLVSLLEDSLKQTRVEEHRTRTPSYREHVVQQEGIIESLLAKLRAE